MKRAISLMYHDVIAPGASHQTSGFPAPNAALYKLDQPVFDSHLRAIAGTAARVGTIHDDAEGSVLLTFDDGGASFLDPVAPMLEAHGWRGHFFMTTDYIGTRGFLTGEQLRELHARGHVIGSHSCTHPLRMAVCSREQLRTEWSESVRRLEDILGTRVDVASVPGGLYSRAVGETAAKAGIRFLFNSEPVTRPYTLDGCTILGRFALQAGSPAEEAGELAAGRRMPALKQWAIWNVKKAVRRVGGERYLRLRAYLLARDAK